MRFTITTTFATMLVACSSSTEIPEANAPNDSPREAIAEAAAELHEPGEVIFTIVDMMHKELLLVDVAFGMQIHVELEALAGWPNATPLHSLILPDKETVFVSLAGSASEPAGIVELRIKGIDWDACTADIDVKKVMITDAPGASSSFPPVAQVDPSQPIAAWTQPGTTQIHAPTLLPGSKFAYFTTWTDNRIRAVHTNAHKLLSFDPLVFGDTSRQTHGIYFNASGTLGIGTGYYYDRGEIDVYTPDKNTGHLYPQGSIKLGTDTEYAAFTHHNRWLDDRYALTSTMQHGPTSLTPGGATVIGPSVWLLDVPARTAQQIIGTASSPEEAGVYRSASDLAIARGKLYVAEEDSLGDVFARDGFVAIYDITDVNFPVFLRRLKPGVELPADFTVAHAMNVTPGEEFIYLESYVSKYVLKIDTLSDDVVEVIGEDAGLMMPHGGFMSGRFN